MPPSVGDGCRWMDLVIELWAASGGALYPPEGEGEHLWASFSLAQLADEQAHARRQLSHSHLFVLGVCEGAVGDDLSHLVVVVAEHPGVVKLAVVCGNGLGTQADVVEQAPAAPTLLLPLVRRSTSHR